jgi:hypothetical protein
MFMLVRQRLALVLLTPRAGAWRYVSAWRFIEGTYETVVTLANGCSWPPIHADTRGPWAIILCPPLSTVDKDEAAMGRSAPR